jgi:multidrug efflux system membrane fusion protein
MQFRQTLTVFSLLAALGLAGCHAAAQTQAGGPPPAPEVTVTDVQTKSLRQWDEFTGRLEAIDSVEIRPRVGGYINASAFEEGARIHKGQLLFQIDPRPFQAEVDRLTAEVNRSKAKLELATNDQGRGQRLVNQNAMAKGEFDQLDSAQKAAVADLAAAQASLESARLNLEFTRVVSPIDGRVGRALITKGNLVTNSSLLTTVVSDTPIYAAFNADEQTFLKYANAQRGTAAPVYMGLMTEDGYPHTGKLHFIDNTLDPKSGTILGRAVFDNADGKFTPGLFARIRLVSDQAQTVALIPDQSIGTDLGKRFVLVLTPDNKVDYRAVTLGPLAGELRIVRTGLVAGDKVVVSGLQKVKPGDAVKPVPIAAAAVNAADLADLGQVEGGAASKPAKPVKLASAH